MENSALFCFWFGKNRAPFIGNHLHLLYHTTFIHLTQKLTPFIRNHLHLLYHTTFIHLTQKLTPFPHNLATHIHHLIQNSHPPHSFSLMPFDSLYTELFVNTLNPVIWGYSTLKKKKRDYFYYGYCIVSIRASQWGSIRDILFQLFHHFTQAPQMIQETSLFCDSL